jgi:hypothetical protein
LADHGGREGAASLATADTILNIKKYLVIRGGTKPSGSSNFRNLDLPNPQLRSKAKVAKRQKKMGNDVNASNGKLFTAQ